MVNRERLVNEFVDLVGIDSLTKHERKMGDKLYTVLTGMGYQPYEDDAGEKIDGTCGNIICKINGNKKASPIMLMSHMDTVKPGISKRAIIKDEIIYSDGTTVLGGDDLAGVACILETIRILKENKIEHGDIYVIFTIAEEGGLFGAKGLDYSKIDAKYAFILDDEGPIGTVAIKAPYYNKFIINLYGKAAHAGLEPEKGINAIQIISKAIAKLPFMGRIDEESSCNLGLINGGTARNIVADYVRLEGEVRSTSIEKLDRYTSIILNTFKDEVNDLDVKIEIELEQMYPGFSLSKDTKIIKILEKASNSIGLELKLHSTGGGSDTNIVNGKGIEAVNLSVGMDKVHTTKEQIKISDMVEAVNFLVEIIKSVD